MAGNSPPLTTKSPTEISSSTQVSINRSSMPSYRPQTKVNAGFRLSAANFCCVRGTPWGDKYTTCGFSSLASAMASTVFSTADTSSPCPAHHHMDDHRPSCAYPVYRLEGSKFETHTDRLDKPVGKRRIPATPKTFPETR